MTREERSIIDPTVTRLRKAMPSEWRSLKYETQFGTCHPEFPYYVPAFEFNEPARAAVQALPDSKKQALIRCWRARPRPGNAVRDEEILERWALVVLDRLVSRACVAGGRTGNW